MYINTDGKPDLRRRECEMHIQRTRAKIDLVRTEVTELEIELELWMRALQENAAILEGTSLDCPAATDQSETQRLPTTGEPDRVS